MQIPVADKTVTAELSGDFTLPDYQPEIKRLLRVVASVLPPSRYVGDREAELAGAVDYYVHYTGSDNEIYCAPLTTEYKIAIPYEGEDGAVAGLTGNAVIFPDLVSGRVTSPRRLNIKCRLRARAMIMGEMPTMGGFDTRAEGIETLRSALTVTKRLWGTGEKLTLNDEMLTDGRGGDLRVISADGRVLMSEAVAEAGRVDCRGELYLKLLMSREDGSAPYSVMRKMPFSCSIAVDGAQRGGSASAKGSVCELAVTVEDNRILIMASVIPETEVCVEERAEYVKDVFSTLRRASCEYRRVTAVQGGTSFGGNFTLSDSLALEEIGLTRDAHVIDASGVVIPEETVYEDGRTAITGKVRFTLLVEKEGEYTTADAELPFRYELKDKGERTICEAEVITVRTRSDGERLGIDAEIFVRGSAWSETSCQMPERVTFGERLIPAKGEWVICYPSAGDSLWSVAKRYGVSAEELAERNGISDRNIPEWESAPLEVEFLMI